MRRQLTARRGVLSALVGPTLRAMRPAPVAGALAAALLVVAVPAVLGLDLEADDHARLLRFAAVCAATGLAFTFDDPAKPTTLAVPVPSRWPATIRGAFGLAAFTAWWAAAVALTYAGADELRLPVPGLTLEAVTVAALALAASAVTCRFSARGVGGPIAAPAALGLALAVAVAPTTPPMFVPATVRGAVWTAVHERWAALLALVLAAIVTAVAAPARPTARSRR
ncbi:hypothetical protein [Dactylosporangium sp. NPDC049140]|uniref:hypothetical protein n=1 Tax=Dactylosporangium sp. NPDC049140 TaxID=3155647 RepID=UPI0033D45F01